MRRIRQNKWTICVSIIAVLAGLALGIGLQGGTQHAEAVLGGIGNLVIQGSGPTTNHPHNFATGSSGAQTSDTNETRICVFCHTPHVAYDNRDAAGPSLINAPLWNHTLSTQTYSVKSPGVYTKAPVPNNVWLVVTPTNQPDGASKLCLSCHDGTVSVGNVRSEFAAGGIPMQVTAGVIIAGGYMDPTHSAYIGTNLTNKHVVSIPMNQGLLNTHNARCNSNGQTTKLKYPWVNKTGAPHQATNVFIRPTATTYGGSMGISGTTITTGGTNCQAVGTQCTKNYGSPYNYGVQCSTCHDPHYWANTTNRQTQGFKMLVIGENSLCLACHYDPITAGETCP